MIIVDTSVWIAAFRNGKSPEAIHLRDLLDADDVALAAPVRIEILLGASRATVAQLKRTLSALPLFYPAATTWLLIEDWLEKAKTAGQTFGMADLLIAAIAQEQTSQIWSLDSDFTRMAQLKLVKLHEIS